jgi:hypothetical protein
MLMPAFKRDSLRERLSAATEWLTSVQNPGVMPRLP